MNALHHTTEDLETAGYPYKLPLRDITVLNLDYKSQGVGGETSWGDKALPLEPHRIKPVAHEYKFRCFMSLMVEQLPKVIP